jgi:hypothetical protein
MKINKKGGINLFFTKSLTFVKNKKVMIKIPYGQSNFRGLIEGGNFYQDRTEYIEKLENWHSKYPVFLRYLSDLMYGVIMLFF